MLKTNNIDAITDETRDYMNRVLDSVYSYKKGSDLDSIVAGVLNDRDVLVFLLNYLKKDEGILLGRMKCKDGATMYIPYGLTVNRRQSTPKTSLFAYKEVMEGIYGLGLYSEMPVSQLVRDAENVPTPKEFARSVNNVLQRLGQVGDFSSVIDLGKIPEMGPQTG